jgi:hypothetical protein
MYKRCLPENVVGRGNLGDLGVCGSNINLYVGLNTPAPSKGQWWTVMYMAMKVQVPQKTKNLYLAEGPSFRKGSSSWSTLIEFHQSFGII